MIERCDEAQDEGRRNAVADIRQHNLHEGAEARRAEQNRCLLDIDTQIVETGPDTAPTRRRPALRAPTPSRSPRRRAELRRRSWRESSRPETPPRSSATRNLS